MGKGVSLLGYSKFQNKNHSRFKAYVLQALNFRDPVSSRSWTDPKFRKSRIPVFAQNPVLICKFDRNGVLTLKRAYLVQLGAGIQNFQSENYYLAAFQSYRWKPRFFGMKCGKLHSSVGTRDMKVLTSKMDSTQKIVLKSNFPGLYDLVWECTRWSQGCWPERQKIMQHWGAQLQQRSCVPIERGCGTNVVLKGVILHKDHIGTIHARVAPLYVELLSIFGLNSNLQWKQRGRFAVQPKIDNRCTWGDATPAASMDHGWYQCDPREKLHFWEQCWHPNLSLRTQRDSSMLKLLASVAVQKLLLFKIWSDQPFHHSKLYKWAESWAW